MCERFHAMRPSTVRAASHHIVSRPPVAVRARAALPTLRRPSSSHAPSPTHGRNPETDKGSIIYAEGQPAYLPARSSDLAAWAVTPSKMGLIRQFHFHSFAAAWRFMSAVAAESTAKRHHPSWHNLYNQVTVEWTTHKPRGLSIKDVEMAEFCDRTADAIGLKAQSHTDQTVTARE